MAIRLRLGLAVLGAALAFAAQAQTPAPSPATPVHPGREVLTGKCFQCHTESMFRDARQDRRAWEATLYRMVGRGALWTADEVKSMADFLGAEFGPNAPATPSK